MLPPFYFELQQVTTIQSGHDILKAEIDFTKFTREKGYWRHNNSLLKDPKYVNRIKNHFRLTVVIIDNFENFFAEANELELQNFLTVIINFILNRIIQLTHTSYLKLF